VIAFRRPFQLAIIVAFLTSALVAVAQQPIERSVPASKDAVQSALQAAGPTNGKLPILDGFVADPDSGLDSYRNGYYQLSVKVLPDGPDRSKIRVAAKVTAWFESKNAQQSGYRVLSSNGRLEGDFLDRVEQALTPGASASSSPSTSAPPPPKPSADSVPESPGSISAATTLSKAATPALPTKHDTAEFAANESNERRIQQLKQQVNDLEQVLRTQAHPDNLIAVKHSGTPVYSRPFEHSTVILKAEAEDEFQIVTTAGSWVHVQVSGLSRGWIPRSDVDLLSSRTVPVASEAPPPAGTAAQPNAAATGFQTREENSMFPGNWAPLRGKTVKIIWVSSGAGGHGDRIKLTKSMFRKAYPELSKTPSDLAGVVVVFDAEDGGMAAATMASLQQWNAGHLSDTAFWKQCWLDPADAFKQKD
jgi:hypothetical protein